jgi:hypothetical protein
MDQTATVAQKRLVGLRVAALTKISWIRERERKKKRGRER